ncbi:MAG: hypothetical protein OXM56_03940, partial [Gammaproteobacteria bacterium]|nr:hypothetical protein [Gammaproteobacteria bacterium]
MNEPLAMDALYACLSSPANAEALSPLAGTPYVLVEGGEASSDPPRCAPSCPVIAVGPSDADVVDVQVDSFADAEPVVDAIERNPIAAMTLVRLLRHNVRTDVADRLFAESLTYSTLQHGA